MDIRLAAAIAAGKGAGLASRHLKRGGGTALPGLVALRIDPRLVSKLGRQLSAGSVLVTGTNGKTTTSRMLASILDAAGEPHLHNREGSNLVRGFASTLLEHSHTAGRLSAAPGTLGLFEADEATMPAAAAAFAPRAMAFTNLFRDQLDRYGEVDTVAALWREALAAAPQTATLVLNADDPSVAELATDWPGSVHWFGLDDPAFATTEKGAFDARWCRACGGTYAYAERYFAHVGTWRCSGCERRRPEPDTFAASVELEFDRASFDLNEAGRIQMPLSGLYNVYNALAAAGLARVLGLPGEAIARGLSGVRAAFGRQEVITHRGRRLRLFLCKNPAGANEVIRLLSATARPEAPLSVAVLLSDRFADGQDVSWIWDVDYEPLGPLVAKCWAGGLRAEDMALRLRYAGWPAPAAVQGQPAPLLSAIARDTPDGGEVAVIATYTSMLDLRSTLGRGVGDEGDAHA